MLKFRDLVEIPKLLLVMLTSLFTLTSQIQAETLDNTYLNSLSAPNNKNLVTTDDSMRQINKVFQLRDVSPVDWTYKALKSLVERYGCIQGYSDQTLQGNKSLTRWEFAAGLNACMTRIERLIQENGSLRAEDLITLKRLTDEFSTELTALGVRVNKLEAQTAFLEGHQFSTTTKLFGNTILQNDVYFAGTGTPNRLLTDFQYSSFLGLQTSFTGQDNLLIGIASTNTAFGNLATNNNNRDVGPTREGASYASSNGDLNNKIYLVTLVYQFPVNDNLNINVVADNRYNFSTTFLNDFSPDYAFHKGPVSTFATSAPFYLLGGGGGISGTYKISPSTVFNAYYLSTFWSSPDQGQGLFNGDYVTAGEIDYNPGPNLFFQAAYQKGYFGPGNFGFNNGQPYRGNGFLGTALANRFDQAGVLFDQASAVSTNGYLVGGYYSIFPKVNVGGWANLVQARLLGKGDANIWNYALQIALPDLFKEGNLGGFVIGMEPALTGLTTTLPHAAFKNDTSLHIEAYYRHQLTNNVSITPYVIWITAPNQDASNPGIILGGFRTILQF